MAQTHPEITEHRRRINNLLEKLRSKLISFAVVNLDGQIIGRIRNFILDQNRHLKVVISKLNDEADSPILLNSEHLQKVDTANRFVLVDLSLIELTRLNSQPTPQIEMVEKSNPAPNSSVNPASLTDSRETLEFEENQIPRVEPLIMGNVEEDNLSFMESEDAPEVVEEEVVRLLEERLVVNRSKRKVGEIVVRKVVETRLVQVPVRREKLIVEQVGVESKPLAEIDLGRGEVTGVELTEVPTEIPNASTEYSVTGEFYSPKAVSELLGAIALQKPHGCKKVRVELVLEDPEFQETYQKMFERFRRI